MNMILVFIMSVSAIVALIAVIYEMNSVLKAYEKQVKEMEKKNVQRRTRKDGR